MELAPWVETVTNRQVTRYDLPALEWNGEFTHFRRVYADAYERVQTGRSVMWVADLPGVGIIGQVFIQLVSERYELADGVTRAYLYSFRVKPAYQGMGLGSRMMETLEDDLRQRGYIYVTLNVARTNERAQDLYRRRGYKIIASESGRWSYPDHRGIWHSVEEPAWRMQKTL